MRTPPSLLAVSMLALASQAFAWNGTERAIYEQMPEPELKRVYLHCAKESSRRLLDQGEAALCSIAADCLQRRAFNNDFNALLVWWRQHRDEAFPYPSEEGQTF